MSAPRFRIGRLDHVHIRVPNRADAAAWYCEHLGFEPVERFAFWAEGFDYDQIRVELIEHDGRRAARYWPAELREVGAHCVDAFEDVVAFFAPLIVMVCLAGLLVRPSAQLDTKPTYDIFTTQCHDRSFELCNTARIH